MLTQIIVFLDGKKQKISAISAIIIGYGIFVGMETHLAFAILGIINVIFGTTAVISDVAVKGNSNLGMSIKDKRLIIK